MGSAERERKTIMGSTNKQTKTNNLKSTEGSQVRSLCHDRLIDGQQMEKTKSKRKRKHETKTKEKQTDSQPYHCFGQIQRFRFSFPLRLLSRSSRVTPIASTCCLQAFCLPNLGSVQSSPFCARAKQVRSGAIREEYQHRVARKILFFSLSFSCVLLSVCLSSM